MKNKIIFVVTVLLFLVIVLYNSFDTEKEEKEKEVLSYLKDKYHEEFKIDNVKVYNYSFEEVQDIEDSYIYEFDMLSQRLVKFKVFIYEYKNDSYDKNNDLDLIRPGLYENYIYEYKIREIENKYYKDVLNIVDKSKNVEFSLDNMYLGLNNIMFLNRFDSMDKINLYNKYNNFNKSVSDKEFLDTYFKLSQTDSLIINMDINKEIGMDNIDDFKNDIKELVKYLNDNDIYNYDINMNLDGYVNARATRYTDNNKEQIYLVFDYPSYYDIEGRFNVIIIDL